MGYFQNIYVFFHDDIIAFTSDENKGQLDHSNLGKNKLLFLLLFSHVVNVGCSKPLASDAF